MNENVKIDYLDDSDIYDLQDKTGIPIFIGNEINVRSFSDAIRELIIGGNKNGKKNSLPNSFSNP